MPEPDLDRIHIRELALDCIVGVNDVERRERQRVCLDLTLSADLRAAARSDDLADTVDYKRLKQAIRARVESSSFRLIESLAEAVAGLCLEEPRVEAVRVRLGKPGALRYARTVEVEILRRRGETGAAP